MPVLHWSEPYISQRINLQTSEDARGAGDVWEHFGLIGLFSIEKVHTHTPLSGFLILRNEHQNMEAAFPLGQEIIMFQSSWAFTECFLRGRHAKIIQARTLSLRSSKQCLSKAIREAGKVWIMSKEVVLLFLTFWPQDSGHRKLRPLRFIHSFLSEWSLVPCLILPAPPTF